MKDVIRNLPAGKKRDLLIVSVAWTGLFFFWLAFPERFGDSRLAFLGYLALVLGWPGIFIDIYLANRKSNRTCASQAELSHNDE